MILPFVRRHARWLAWLAAVLTGAGFALVHALQVQTYLGRTTAARLHGDLLTVPLQQIPQGFAADGQMWIRHALSLAEAPGHALRLRFTDLDNAPFGREVHWNSAWAWWLAGLGRLDAWLNGTPLATAIERMALWANLPVFLLALAGFSAWAGRRFGALGAVVIALGMAGHRGFYEGFYPAYPDHHGLINAAILGLLLGALGMGAGWWQAGDGTDPKNPSLLPRSFAQARRAAVFSGLAGGLGLWFSASSLIPPIALTGLAGFLASRALGDRLLAGGAVCAPALWRLWSRTGAAVSFACYLLEYAPQGFALRLEVNHPLYSLAWLGGGELIARWLAARFTVNPEPAAPASRTARFRALPALLAVAAAPAALLIGGSRWFAIADPVMAPMYAQIDEIKPLWDRIAQLDWWSYRDHAGVHLLPFVFAAWLLTRRLVPAVRLVLLTAATTAFFMTVLGWCQNRWLLTASGAQIVLVLVLLLAWNTRRRVAARPGWFRWAAALAACLALYLPAPWMLLSERAEVERVRDVQMGETIQLLYRDIAQRLRDDRPAGGIVLLADPNASTGIGYYGRFRTLGTFYWENHAGLRAAAAMLSAPAVEAAPLVRARHVTHIVLVSARNFLPGYFALAHPELPSDDIAGTLGETLLAGGEIPPWLRPLDYTVPDALVRIGLQARLYAVDFDQPPALGYHRIGLFHLALGNTSRALADFAVAASAGNPESAATLAWLLATSPNDAIRNGPNALRLAQAAVDARPGNATLRGVLAAAFAENGRFPEANGAVLHALELAEASGDEALITRLTAQFNAYQESRPWRE